MSAQVFKPSIDLSFTTVQSDGQRLLNLLRETDTTIIRLDLSDVTHCDSAGLALLIEARRLCLKFDKTLLIEGMTKNIATLAEFCGVESMLTQLKNSNVC